jgi:sulfur carrier protein
MRVALNGQPRELGERATVAQAVAAAGADPSGRGLAVAVDGQVVPHAEWSATQLEEGQRVEVLQAVQGG